MEYDHRGTDSLLWQETHIIMKTTLEPIPTWALCYLINGDRTSIEPEDEAIIEAWQERSGILEVICPDDASDSYFSPCPAFGLACDVVECECVLEW